MDLIIRPVFFQPKLMSGLALTFLMGMGLGGCIDDSSIEGTKAEIVSREGDLARARVDDSMIYASDVQRAAKAQGTVVNGQLLQADDPAYVEILNELIDQRLLKLEALQLGIDRAPEVKRRLWEARERILATYLVEQQLKAAVSDESLRELYTSQAALRQNAVEANVRLIRVPTEDAVKAVSEKLSAGADFGTVASEYSVESQSRNNGGELGYVSRVMMDEDIADVVFTLKAGARSKPFQTKDGWNIVEVLEFKTPQQASFESMRDELLKYKTYTEIDGLMTKLRSESDVEILIKKDTTDSNSPDEVDNE